MQTTIDDQAHIFTLINTFKVRNGQAAQVVGSLRNFTEEQTTRMPGFVGASVRVSVGATTVVNYVQWKTRDAAARRHKTGWRTRRPVAGYVPPFLAKPE